MGKAGKWYGKKGCNSVTLITRPRRFGKTLNMSMLEQFFSIKYADKGKLFAGLAIWKEEKYRELQGTYPVISISFASVKETNYVSVREKICELLPDLYNQHMFLRNSEVNLKVVTTTSDEYATYFGFTEEEVFAGLEECGLENDKGR